LFNGLACFRKYVSLNLTQGTLSHAISTFKVRQYIKISYKYL